MVETVVKISVFEKTSSKRLQTSQKHNKFPFPTKVSKTSITSRNLKISLTKYPDFHLERLNVGKEQQKFSKQAPQNLPINKK